MRDPFADVAALPGVPAAVDAARAAVDRLLAHRVLRHRSAEVTAECALRSARASAALDGAEVPLPALRAATGEVAAGLPPAVVGAVRLLAELGALLPVWERAPRQALARMHVLAAPGVAGDRLGRPRGPGAPADDVLGLGAAPSAGEAAARLDGLADLLLAPTSAPASVVAAVVHGELLAVRPFGYADGLVARAAGRLVLVGRGLDPKALSSPEVGHRELATEYVAAARGYVRGGPAGVAGWVAHCARAVETGAREGLAVCEALLRAS